MRLKALPPRIGGLKPRVTEPKGTGWRAGKTSTQRGYGYAWQQARAAFLREHPLCTMCEAKGWLIAATVVDHITPHQGNEVLFWERTNWQPLCASCHSSEKQRQENNA